MSKRYVQHVSGNGKRYEVVEGLCPDPAVAWPVRNEGGTFVFYLPKSEYTLYPPPEQWLNVTGECTVSQYGAIYHCNTDLWLMCIHARGRYRMRYVLASAVEPSQPVFIVEQNKEA